MFSQFAREEVAVACARLTNLKTLLLAEGADFEYGVDPAAALLRFPVFNLPILDTLFSRRSKYKVV